MAYYIDFNELSLESFKIKLKNSDLVPSRQILIPGIENNFVILESAGFKNITSLLNSLKKKSSLQELALETGINEEYLVILSREIRSWLPKPEKLTDFKDIPPLFLQNLKEMGIENTFHLWKTGLTPLDRESLSIQSGVPYDQITGLVCLSDLCRVRWVNYSFAQILDMAGIKTAEQLSQQDYESLHRKVVHLNELHQWYKAKIGKNDFSLVIKAASELSFDLILETFQRKDNN